MARCRPHQNQPSCRAINYIGNGSPIGGLPTSQGKSAVDAIRSIGVTDATFYRWRQEYGGLKVDQVKRMKELEAENARLRRAVSDLTLEKLVLKEAASGNF
jgi:transposase-like protein